MVNHKRIQAIRCLQVCAFGLLAFVPSAHCQTDIVLRFIDAESGKAISGISVSVDAWDENEGRQKPQPSGILRIDENSAIVKTDKDGKGIFHLHYQPSLKTLNVHSVGVLRGCSGYKFSIEGVLHSGVVASYQAGNPQWCVPLKAHANARPGEIVIFDKRLTLLDRIRQEIP